MLWSENCIWLNQTIICIIGTVHDDVEKKKMCLDDAEGRVHFLCQSHPHIYVYREYTMYVAGVVYVLHIEKAVAA